MPYRSRCKIFSLSLLAGTFLFLTSLAVAQILDQDQEVDVHDLPALMARSHDSSDVLLTSLDVALHDRNICCGRDSALEHSAQAADPRSLRDVAAKIMGTHLLSDGRPITISAQCVAPDAVSAGRVVSAIVNQHPPLMMWKGNLYVVSGVVFIWRDNQRSGTSTMYIHKFLLIDTRYADARRTVVFDREMEDPGKVGGLLFLQVEPTNYGGS